MLARMQERLGLDGTRLERSLERTLRRWAARLDGLEGRLRSLSPLAVLERGYALVLSGDGTVIRSTAEVGPGDQLRTRLSDGEFSSTVDEVAGKKKRKK